MQKALDGSFSDCEFRWEDGHCVKAHLAYLSRNQTFREAAAPKVVPVPSEVSERVLQALLDAHYACSSTAAVQFHPDDNPADWPAATRGFVVGCFGLIQPSPCRSPDFGNAEYVLCTGDRQPTAPPPEAFQEAAPDQRASSAQPEPAPVEAKTAEEEPSPASHRWELIQGLASPQEHFPKLLETGMASDAAVVAPDGSWRIAVHRILLCDKETPMSAKFLRWTPSAEEATPEVESPVSREESVRLVLARAFYCDKADFSEDAAVLLDAFLFAAYLDLPRLIQALRGHIQSLLTCPRRKVPVPDKVQRFACDLLRESFQVRKGQWSCVSDQLSDMAELAVMTIWDRLDNGRRTELSQILPEGMCQALSSRNTLFQSTGHPIIDCDEYFSAWREDIATQISRAYEDWDGRWSTFAVRLKPLGMIAMQAADGSPAGLLFPVGKRPQRLPSELEREYRQLQAEFMEIEDRIQVCVNRECLRLFRKKRVVGDDSSQEEETEKMRDAAAAMLRDKWPRLSYAVALWATSPVKVKLTRLGFETLDSFQ